MYNRCELFSSHSARFDSIYQKFHCFTPTDESVASEKNVPSPFATMPPPHPQMMQSWSVAARPWDRFQRAKKTFHSRFGRACQSSQHCKGGDRLVVAWSCLGPSRRERFFRSGREGLATMNTGAHASDIVIPVLKRPCPFAASCRRQM